MKKSLALLVVLALVLTSAVALTGPVTAQNAVLVVWADEISAPVISGLVADFEDDFGVTVEVQQLQFDQIRGEFITAAPAGEGPDVLIGAHDWLGELVVNGLLSPVDLADVASELNPNAIDAFTFAGEVYGLPYAVENTAFFRNVDILPERPETWDDLLALAPELAEDGISAYVIQMRDPWHSYTVVSAFGGYVFGFDNGYDPQDVGLDSEGTIAAYTFLGELIANGYMPADLQQEAMWELFTSGRAASMVTGPWALETLRASGVNFEISPAPDGPGGPARPFLGARGFMVSAESENPTLAQAFLTEFLASDEVMQALFDAESRPPAWLNVVVEDEAIEAFRTAGATGAPMPNIPEMSAVWESWSNQMELSLRNPANAASEAATAAEQVRAAIGD